MCGEGTGGHKLVYPEGYCHYADIVLTTSGRYTTQLRTVTLLGSAGSCSADGRLTSSVSLDTLGKPTLTILLLPIHSPQGRHCDCQGQRWGFAQAALLP